jgi:hypothetical protein
MRKILIFGTIYLDHPASVSDSDRQTERRQTERQETNKGFRASGGNLQKNNTFLNVVTVCTFVTLIQHTTTHFEGDNLHISIKL